MAECNRVDHPLLKNIQIEQRHQIDQDKVRAAIAHIWSFLQEFIPLINTHGAEFLSHRHWNKFISQSIGKMLLSLNSRQLSKLPLSNFSDVDLSQDDKINELESEVSVDVSLQQEHFDFLDTCKEKSQLPKSDINSISYGVGKSELSSFLVSIVIYFIIIEYVLTPNGLSLLVNVTNVIKIYSIIII